MRVSRRSLLKGAVSLGAVAALPVEAIAQEVKEPEPEAVGLLYDSTRCVGCGGCVAACRESNHLPYDGDTKELNNTTKNVVKTRTLSRPVPGGPTAAFVKRQCMHCIDPSCVSACMLGAMHKEGTDKRSNKGERTGTGVVLYDKELCVGCRYCQIACAYTVPKFEWFEAAPRIVKCEMCHHRADRTASGPTSVANPACAEVCPAEAVIFGHRVDLLKEAHRRLETDPQRYNGKIFGEHDGGGTQMLYLAPAGATFKDLGFPEMPEHSPASLSVAVSHAPYLHGLTPLAFYAAAAFVIRQNSKTAHPPAVETVPGPKPLLSSPPVEPKPESHAHPRAKPIGGVILDRAVLVLLGLFSIAEAVIAYRFMAGIGAVSNMNDGYAWGIWEPVNVVVFTGIGAGAYSVGFLCYILNRGRYHPLVRPAVLLAAIAYSLGGSSILVALGRPWNIYWLAMPAMWNLSSVLLEVAICVMAYVGVLWIEMLPAVFDGAAASSSPGTSAWGKRWAARLAKAMPFIIALAMLLPTMHQSSLGGLMVVSGPKLHPLWQTQLLPLLALVSCLSMGLGAVVVLTGVMKHTWNARHDHGLLVDMSKVNGFLLLAFAVVRLVDIGAHGKFHYLTESRFFLFFFVLEMSLFLIPAILFLTRAVERSRNPIRGGAHGHHRWRPLAGGLLPHLLQRRRVLPVLALLRRGLGDGGHGCHRGGRLHHGLPPLPGGGGPRHSGARLHRRLRARPGVHQEGRGQRRIQGPAHPARMTRREP